MITPGKEDSLKYWWLHISIQSGSRYIKLLPFLFLFLQGWHPKIFILSALAWVLQCHVWMSAMQPGVEAGEGNQWTLYAEGFCFPFASAVLERALHQMSAAICPWPTYRLILGIVEWPTWTRDLMQNTRKEYLRAQMQILKIVPLGTEWNRVQYAMLCVFPTEWISWRQDESWTCPHLFIFPGYQRLLEDEKQIGKWSILLSNWGGMFGPYHGFWLQESYTWIWQEWKWVQPGTPQNFINFFL